MTVRDISTGRRLFDIGCKEIQIVRFCLSPNGRVLYTCGDKVLGWDRRNRLRLSRNSTQAADEYSASPFLQTERCSLLAGRTGAVLIWHAGSRERLADLTHDTGPVYCLAFSHDSRKLVAAGEGGVATIWEIELSLTLNQA